MRFAFAFSFAFQKNLLGKTENCTLEGLKLHTFQVNIFDFLGIDQLAIAPEADFG